MVLEIIVSVILRIIMDTQQFTNCQNDIMMIVHTWLGFTHNPQLGWIWVGGRITTACLGCVAWCKELYAIVGRGMWVGLRSRSGLLSIWISSMTNLTLVWWGLSCLGWDFVFLSSEVHTFVNKLCRSLIMWAIETWKINRFWAHDPISKKHMFSSVPIFRSTPNYKSLKYLFPLKSPLALPNQGFN